MFANSVFQYKNNLEEAQEKRKIKKLLFNEAKNKFSDIRGYKLKYYHCVDAALNDDALEDREVDKEIIRCKLKMNEIKGFVDDTNKHAQIKVNRCINSKREWARKFNQDLESEEKGVWECLNRYHRRYLYYYPEKLEKNYSFSIN